jgi:hypothetical protein
MAAYRLACPVLLLATFMATTADAKCQPGTFKNGGKCQACPKGQYQDLSDQSACKKCPAGTYADSEGFAYCRVCGVGGYGTSATGSVSATTACKSCGKGRRLGPVIKTTTALINDKSLKVSDAPTKVPGAIMQFDIEADLTNLGTNDYEYDDGRAGACSLTGSSMLYGYTGKRMGNSATYKDCAKLAKQPGPNGKPAHTFMFQKRGSYRYCYFYYNGEPVR